MLKSLKEEFTQKCEDGRAPKEHENFEHWPRGMKCMTFIGKLQVFLSV